MAAQLKPQSNREGRQQKPSCPPPRRARQPLQKRQRHHRQLRIRVRAVPTAPPQQQRQPQSRSHVPLFPQELWLATSRPPWPPRVRHRLLKARTQPTNQHQTRPLLRLRRQRTGRTHRTERRRKRTHRRRRQAGSMRSARKSLGSASSIMSSTLYVASGITPWPHCSNSRRWRPPPPTPPLLPPPPPPPPGRPHTARRRPRGLSITPPKAIA